MSKNLKKDLQFRHNTREHLAEYFDTHASETNDLSDQHAHEVRADALEAHSQDDATPSAQAEHKKSSARPHIPDSHWQYEQEHDTPITPAEDRLLNLFHTLIVNHYSLPETPNSPEHDENLVPLMSFDALPGGGDQIVLMPYPQAALSPSGDFTSELFQLGMLHHLEQLFLDLEEPARKHGVKLLRLDEADKFIIKYSSPLDLLHMLEDVMKEGGVQFHEEVESADVSTFVAYSDMSREGEFYFSSDTEYENYLKERLLFDQSITDASAAANYDDYLMTDIFNDTVDPEPVLSEEAYFLEGVPPTVFVDFREAARLTAAHQRYVLQGPDVEDTSLARLKEALWQQSPDDLKSPRPQINPLLRLH